MKVSGNINDHLWVQLTPYGQTILRDWVNKLDYPSWTSADRGCMMNARDAGEGWSKFQFWEFMQIFGPKMRQTTEPMFKDGTVCYTNPLYL